MRSWFVIGLLALAVGTSGCEKRSVLSTAVGSNSPPPQTNRTYHLDHAQPKLRTLKLWLGAAQLTTEIALTTTEISTGMMFRKEMGEDEGMLFVFAHSHQTSFYMKNTTVPLSAAYIDPEGVIVEIHDLHPLNEEAVPAKSDRIQYVLEVKQGWFDRHKVGVGAVIRTEVGSLEDLFFGQGKKWPEP